MAIKPREKIAFVLVTTLSKAQGLTCLVQTWHL